MLKEDNKRLMDMLRQTKEFQNFAGYVDDCGGNVRTTAKQPANEDQINDEWVPEQAYTAAHDFRKKYGSELTYDLVNVMLSDLNKIWHESVRK